MKVIFYADDDAEDIEIFTEAVTEVVSEAEIIPAFCCEELLEKIEKKLIPPPDYIFLDLNMPKTSGRVCLKNLRKNPILNDTKVIILSTSTNTHDIHSTYNDGADYYISKPSSFKGYKDVLSKVFTLASDTRPTKEEFVIN